MKTVRLLTLLSALAAQSGCGLPDQYFLAPPAVPTPASQLSYSFQFSNPNHANDLSVAFSGFDVYYKFYSELNAIEQNAYDVNDVADAVTQLTNKGFHSLCAATDAPPNRNNPVIPVAVLVQGDSFVVSLYLNDPQGASAAVPVSHYSYTPPSTGIAVDGEVRRNAKDQTTGTGYRTFASEQYVSVNYQNTEDMPDQVYQAAILNGGIVYVAMYAMSYGLINLSTPARSAPVYLGYLETHITS